MLMAWADMDDIVELVRYGGRSVRALCVITWNEEGIRPWVPAVWPQVLGDGAAWDDRMQPELDPVVVEALNGLTATVNHNNTISAGFEKDIVVSSLLAPTRRGHPYGRCGHAGLGSAHGWAGSNPARLAKYVDDINAGKRPRCCRVLRVDYVDELRRRAEETA